MNMKLRFFRMPRITFYALLISLYSLVSLAPAQTTAGQTTNKPLAEYNSIIVEEVKLDNNPNLAKFPAGHDTNFQKKIVADLQKKKVFTEVIDGMAPADEQKPAANNPAGGKRLKLSTTIIDFDPGSKALRYTIGWGAGATKVKAKFVFSDAETGQEIWSHTQQGKFLGFITVHGTGKDYSVTEASGDIVDGLIKIINKYR